MYQVTCADVQQWLQQEIAGGQHALPDQSLVAHVVECAVCQGSLMLLAASFVEATEVGMDVTLERCEHDLAAYIDIEREQGVAAALREYPHVWWRIWTDPDFAAQYQSTVILVEAEEVGMLSTPLIEHVIDRLRFLVRMLVPRLTLRLSFETTLGFSWGDELADSVLTEEFVDGYRLTVAAQPQDGNLYRITVTITPAVAGQVVLTLGADVFRARVDANGVAVVPAIPADLLTGADGPDLIIEVEQVTPPDGMNPPQATPLQW